MSDHIHVSGHGDRWKLRESLDALCMEADGPLVRSLAFNKTRWSSVMQLLQASELQALEEIAYGEGFSLVNLKAHYVLDEDFVDDGTAFVVFALVGSTWAHVCRLTGQCAVVSAEDWLEGDVE